MIDETNQSPFFQDLNEIYKEREQLFQQREQDYLKQKLALTNLLETIKKEKSKLEETAEIQTRKQEELRKEEEHQQSWYRQICEEKKQMEKEREQLKKDEAELNVQKDAIEVKFQMQIEKAKNMEILANQRKEEYEHKLNMLGLVLDADGKPGTESTKFFESLLGRTDGVNTEEMQALEDKNQSYQKQIQKYEQQIVEMTEKQDQLQEEKTQLSEELQKTESEKNRLLELLSNLSKEEEMQEEDEEVEDVPNFGTEEEEYIPTFGRGKEHEEAEKDIFEELTASVLQKYLSRNEPKYISSEIKHSEEGEQLHVNINNLDYVFLFSQPAAFEISASKKKSRALERLLVRLNTQHPQVKFYYDEQDNRVYASGYFSNTMTPENLMERVHEVSDCFRQK